MKKLLSVLSVFALAAIAAGTASAGEIRTPAGLKEGDLFRIVFVTSTKRDALSSDLASYDEFVTTEAKKATHDARSRFYPPDAPGEESERNIKWQAIVSNSSINARDHISSGYGIGSLNIPSYDVYGNKISNDVFWRNEKVAVAAYQKEYTPIIFDIDGRQQVSRQVWTGTWTDGARHHNPIYAMGGSNAMWQRAHQGINNEFIISTSSVPGAERSLYGISEVLQVVPEPSTAVLAGLGGLAALLYSFKRKRS